MTNILKIPKELTEVYFSPRTWEEYQYIYIVLAAFSEVNVKKSYSQLLEFDFVNYPELYLEHNRGSYLITGYKRGRASVHLHRKLMTIEELERY